MVILVARTLILLYLVVLSRKHHRVQVYISEHDCLLVLGNVLQTIVQLYCKPYLWFRYSYYNKTGLLFFQSFTFVIITSIIKLQLRLVCYNCIISLASYKPLSKSTYPLQKYKLVRSTRTMQFLVVYVICLFIFRKVGIE